MLKLLMSEKARPLRFLLIGGLAGLIQLSLLYLMTKLHWNPIYANILAFLLAAQVNFLCSTAFTWYDRVAGSSRLKTILDHWVRFHLSISGTALLNQGVFLCIHTSMPTLLASALGIVAAALLNFLLSDRFVFRKRR